MADPGQHRAADYMAEAVRSPSPLTVTAHDNVVYSVISADSLSPQHVTWYLRDGAKPLRYPG